MQEHAPDAPVSVTVQTVVYQNSLASLTRTLEALDNSALVGKREGFCSRLLVVLGDASPLRVLSDEQVLELNRRFSHIDEVIYTYFAENTGTSKGHNLMVELTPSEHLVIANPDIVVDARALWRLVSVLEDPGVGIAEAKQLPVEHPKEYDPETGLTSWASGAFSMTRRSLFQELGGFDEQSFFMYCDDVDYSWRVREAGYSVVFQPAALAYHDKRLTPEGRWMPTSAEHYYSAEAALLLAHKWSRDDVLTRILAAYEASGSAEQKRASEVFQRRHESGELAPPRDAEHRVGRFVKGNYAEHRYAL